MAIEKCETIRGLVFFALGFWRGVTVGGYGLGTQVDFNFSKLNSVGDPFFRRQKTSPDWTHWELWTEQDVCRIAEAGASLFTFATLH